MIKNLFEEAAGWTDDELDEVVKRLEDIRTSRLYMTNEEKDELITKNKLIRKEYDSYKEIVKSNEIYSVLNFHNWEYATFKKYYIVARNIFDKNITLEEFDWKVSFNEMISNKYKEYIKNYRS